MKEHVLGSCPRHDGDGGGSHSGLEEPASSVQRDSSPVAASCAVWETQGGRIFPDQEASEAGWHTYRSMTNQDDPRREIVSNSRAAFRFLCFVFIPALVLATTVLWAPSLSFLLRLSAPLLSLSATLGTSEHTYGDAFLLSTPVYETPATAEVSLEFPTVPGSARLDFQICQVSQ